MFVSTDKIVTTGKDDAIDVSSYDDLYILANVEVAADYGAAVGLASGSANNIIVVDGHANSESTAIFLDFTQGNEEVTVGSTGTVGGETAGIAFYTNSAAPYSGYTASLNNLGDISGNEAIESFANSTQIQNAGQIIGNAVAIDFSDDALSLFGNINNAAPGVISGNQNAIIGASAHIANSGQITSTSTSYFTIDLSSGGSMISSSGGISANGGALYFGGSYNKVDNSGTITAGAQAVYSAGGDDAIQNSGQIDSAGGSAIYVNSGSVTLSSTGEISAAADTILFENGGDTIDNSGTISAAQIQAIDIGGGGNFIENSGKITATNNTISVSGGVSVDDWVVNDAGGEIAANGTGTAVNDSTGEMRLVNHGDIGGGVDLGGGSLLTNTGNIDGALRIEGGGTVIRNAGEVSVETGDDVYIAGGHSGATEFDDRLVNTSGGIIDAAGATAVYHASVGTFRLVNHGEIDGALTLDTKTTLVNAGPIDGEIAFGAAASLFVNRGLVDGDVTFSGTGNIYRGLSGEVTGTIYGAGADGRYFGGAGDDTFNLTAGGAQYVSGGAGDDAFLFTASGLTASARVLGGDGNDSLTFTNAGTISPSAFAHVSGIETINLAYGANNLTLTDALVSSASGGALTVNGSGYLDTINASAVTTAGDTVTMYGGVGADTMVAGGGKDIFAYHAASESTGPGYDTVAGVNFNIDRFDVSAAAKTILAVNAAVTTGSLSTASFNADLVNDLPAAKLGAHDAVLFTANAGTLSGQTFLIVDANGVAGYQANADLVIHLTAATGTLTKGSFI